MKKGYEKLEKTRKITEILFMGIILALFLAFLLLWMYSEMITARYIVGAALICVVFVYRSVDKSLALKLKTKEDALRQEDKT